MAAEGQRRRRREEIKEERRIKAENARKEALFEEMQRAIGHTRIESLESVEKMASFCRMCGNTEIHRYGHARPLKLCRECYQGSYESLKLFGEYLETHPIEETKYGRLNQLEFYRAERTFFREKRESNGIFEPVLICSVCKKEKPLFEYWHISAHRPDFLKDLTCIECDSFLRQTKVCPKCGKRKEKEDFEDDDYKYTHCIDCRNKMEEERERRLYSVDEKALASALNYRGLEHNEENAAIVSELILAKRIMRELNSVVFQRQRRGSR